MNLRTVVISSILLICIGSLIGQVWAPDSVSVGTDDDISVVEDSVDLDDAEVRENPVIEGEDEDIKIDVPSFIRQGANHIKMNGADWSGVRDALSKSRCTPFSIVHIGDSHLQADIASGAVREFLQYDYGNAGRGLVIPFRLAGSNEPWDYSISSKSSWKTSKILRRPWAVPMGFTGISIQPGSETGDLFIATRDDANYNPFNTLTIYHSGSMNIRSVEDRDGKDVKFSQSAVKGGTLLRLASEENGVRLRFDGSDLIINGINLSGNRPGVFYHTIGNNGATFGSYESIDCLGTGIANLHPNLIIVSVGTNDAFGRFDSAAFSRSLDSVIRQIRRTNPNAAILLTTPMECQKSVYGSTKKVKKRVKVKGRWVTKYVNQSSGKRGYGVNQNVKLVRDVIARYAEKNHIALYDWYDVAGGDGASEKWIKDDLYGNDRVHHTAKGYRLNGFLLYQALSEAFKSNN